MKSSMVNLDHRFDDKSASILRYTFRLTGLTLAFMFLGFGLFSTGLLNARFAAAETVTVSVENVGYYVRIKPQARPADGLSFYINPNENDGMSAITDTITINSNTVSGYMFYITAKDSNMYLDRNPTADPRKIIRPIDANMERAARLQPNTWGFSIPRHTPGLARSNFNVDYNRSDTNPRFKPNAGMTWAAVRNRIDFPVQYFTKQVGSSKVKINYGVRVDQSLEQGDYGVDVVYTVIADGGASGGTTVSPNRFSGNVGDRIEISTPIYSNYQFSASDIKVTIGDDVCSEPSITQNDSQLLRISCKVPQKPSGTYDVVLRIPEFTVPITVKNAFTYP